MRVAILGLILFPVKAFAHVGLHHHPHGVDYGWIIACTVGIYGGYVLSHVKGRLK